MFNPMYVENAPQGGAAVLEVLGREHDRMPFVPLQSVAVSGEVTGPVAGMQIVHVFSYTREQCSRVLEAAYRFPLPGDAAVTGVSVRFGDTEIQAVLEPRAQAEEDYEQAKRDRKQSALVTQEAPDVFTLRVAGIKPDEEVHVETAFVQLARAEGAGWSLRIPLTVAERFTRHDEGSRSHKAGPLAQATNPGYRATLDLTVVGAAAVSGVTHPLAITRDGNEQHVGFRGGSIVPDSDVVVAWQPAAGEEHPALSAFTAHRDDHVSFVALVTPPTGEQAIIPRDLVVLVDHSGSMNGAKWDAADWAVKRLIGMLTEQDRLRLGVFHDTTAWWSDVPRAMDGQARTDAVHFLETHRDSGGTELGIALEQALRGSRPAGAYACHVLIVTDAQVTDEGRLMRLAAMESGRPDHRRISILCIDSSPNEPLARQLAETGGGYDRYVTSNPEGEDITTALDAIVDTWARPVATGLRLEIHAANVGAASRRAMGSSGGWTVLDLGDLPGGMPLWVSGEAYPASQLSMRLVDGDGQELAAWTEQADSRSYPAVAALSGARTLQKLEGLRGAGYKHDELSARLASIGVAPAEEGGTATVYPENNEPDDMLATVICRESLRVGIASSETAFVAIRSKAGKSVERMVIIPNAVPEGWEDVQPVFVSSMVNAPSLLLNAPRAVQRTARKVPRMMFNDSAVMSGIQPAAVTLFDAVAPTGTTRAVLAERTIGATGKQGLPASRLTSLHATGDQSACAPGIELLLFVGDMARARARVRLCDLLQGSVRPLNITCRDGEVVRLVLVTSDGGKPAIGHLTITLGIA